MGNFIPASLAARAPGMGIARRTAQHFEQRMRLAVDVRVGARIWRMCARL
jgi:hypothetical protein